MTSAPDLAVDRRLDLISQQTDFLVAEAMKARELKDSLVELSADLSPITRQVMDSATAALAIADQRGYMDFARSGLGIADRIVTEFNQVREEFPAEPPSLFTLARRLRDPNVRRGLDRLVVALEILGSSDFEREQEKGARL